MILFDKLTPFAKKSLIQYFPCLKVFFFNQFCHQRMLFGRLLLKNQIEKPASRHRGEATVRKHLREHDKKAALSSEI